ncbi:hypothetical protein [uncultured Serinicoccus sp.]|uniref:hypothetical protein n=1 Tax=uncultured Serinicoccus sp. TaxID=735514 RepID=UPI00261491C6|nr:hypothetical protein [uncultured Serinicoccus sp.]
MTGMPLVASPIAGSPPDGLVERLEERLNGLHVAVSTCQDELERWGAHAVREQVAAQVVVDQAGLLRHQVRDAASDAAWLLARVRNLERRPGVARIAISPVTLAVATAASSLHATVHAMSPASSGLCRGEQFMATVDTSLGASRRFLRVACSALLDATRLLRTTQPGEGGPASTGDHRPHLRLVPDTGASIEGDPR